MEMNINPVTQLLWLCVLTLTSRYTTSDMRRRPTEKPTGIKELSLSKEKKTP